MQERPYLAEIRVVLFLDFEQVRETNWTFVMLEALVFFLDIARCIGLTSKLSIAFVSGRPQLASDAAS